MGQGVYLESSVFTLEPKVLNFLHSLIDKYDGLKDSSFIIKATEIADNVGKSVRTVRRYLKELESNHIIEVAGRKGRSGGTLIRFNTELIRFNSSEEALIVQDDSTPINDLLDEKMPKKPEEPKKRNRRTKQQMMEDELLNKQDRNFNHKMNKKLYWTGGVPTWEWFEETEEPVNNYRAYLISRMYNRYAALFTDKHNSDVMEGLESVEATQISNGYDVLPLEFLGTPRWHQFTKLRKFLDDNDIDPVTYLSAQFNRSIFSGTMTTKKKRNVLPYVNALCSDTSYDVYIQYRDYQKRGSQSFASFYNIPARFQGDYVIQLMQTAYAKADHQIGLLHVRYAIQDFLEGESGSEKGMLVSNFYQLTKANLRKENVPVQDREVIKKFVLTQSMMQLSGIQGLPKYLILGGEMTRAMLASIGREFTTKEEAEPFKAQALGRLINPHGTEDEQEKEGRGFLYQMNVMNETPHVVNLMLNRLGLQVGIHEVRRAVKSYGADKLPIDQLSMLDIDQVESFMTDYINQYDNEEEPREEESWESDYSSIVETKKDELKMTQSIGQVDSIEEDFNEFLRELED